MKLRSIFFKFAKKEKLRIKQLLVFSTLAVYFLSLTVNLFDHHHDHDHDHHHEIESVESSFCESSPESDLNNNCTHHHIEKLESSCFLCDLIHFSNDEINLESHTTDFDFYAELNIECVLHWQSFDHVQTSNKSPPSLI